MMWGVVSIVDSAAVALLAIAIVALFYGSGGLIVRRRATPEELNRELERGKTDRRWQRVQSNAFETSVKNPVFLLVVGCVALAGSVGLWIIYLTS